MSEPNAEAVIKDAAKRSRKTADEPVSDPAPVAEVPSLLSVVLANPFTDESGNSLADDGQRVN